MRKIIIFLILLSMSIFFFGENSINKTLLKQKFLEKHLELKYQNVLNLPKVSNPYAPDAINLRIGSFFTRDNKTPDFSYLSKYFTQNNNSIFDNYWIIQFYGPILPDWRKQVEKSGLKIIEYIPNNAYLVKGNILKVKNLKDKHLIRWYGLWQNAYKIQPELILFEKDKDFKNIPVRVVTFPDVDGVYIKNGLLEYGAKIVKKSCNSKKRWIFDINIPSNNLTVLTTIKGVKWVEIRIPYELYNNIARSSDNIPTGRGPDANDSNDDGPLMNVDAVWAKGIHGEGQIVAEADTGLDTGDLSTLNEDFGKQGDTNNPMRVIKAYALGRSTWDDDGSIGGGHGTHTAGSLCGNGYHSGSDPGSNYFPSTCYAGTAPKAELVFQSVMDSNGNLGGLPSDLHDLFSPPYSDGARVHSNSWGAPVAGEYDQDASDTDDFMWNNPDMVITFSAGNSGVDGQVYSNGSCSATGDPIDGVIDADSMGSPGTAKNVITVGASENYRPDAQYEYPQGTCNDDTWGWFNGCSYSVDPIKSDHMADNASGMAAFSSRGPCDDGRIKPDIVAPGTFILSVKSQEVNWDQWGQCGLSDNDKNWYLFMGGTSMANPLTAGCCALIQQYYKEGWFVDGTKNTSQGITPSAALVKATLLNGAWDMYPGQYGTGSTQEIPTKRPNNVEGWGRVDLYDTLYFSGDSRNLIFDDHTTGITTGDSVSYTVCNQSTTEPLKFTLVWTDPAGATSASKELVNDLDLKVTAPDGTTVYYPNGGSGADHTNNVEGIDIPVSDLQTGEYTVEVSGYNVPGNGSTNSDHQPFALVISGGGIHFGMCCTSYPPAPTNLTTSLPAKNTVGLSWDAVSGADHYNIYRSDGACPGSTFTLLDSSTTNSYNDTTVAGGKTYSYKVTSVDSNGCESTDYSNCADATPYGDCTEPPTFGGLENISTLNTGVCGFHLTWSPATNNCTGDTTGIVYNIYRSTTSGFTPSSSNLIASCVTDTFYNDIDISTGTTYYYIVRAEDSTSNGSGPCHHGNEDTNTVEKSGIVGGTTTLLSQDFEDNLTGWAYFTATDGWDGSGNSTWHTTNAQAYSGSYSAHCGDSGSSYTDKTDQVLSSPAITIPSNATSATLTFYHYYYNEDGYDGTQLYISTSGQSTLGSLVTGLDYDGTISTYYSSPIGGEKAWTGQHESWSPETVDLSAYIGQTIYIQWRFVSDTSVDYNGYYLDDVKVECDTPPCSSSPLDVKFFNVTASDSQVTFEWVNPDSYSGCSTMIRYSTSDYPQTVNDGTEACNVSGSAGERNTYTLTGLTNGTKYYFTCFVVCGSDASPGKEISATPFSDTGKPWDYVTKATTLMPPSVLPDLVYFSSNTREIHGLDYSTGKWHGSSWVPVLTNGAVQDFAPIVPYTIGSSTNVIFASAQDGKVYAIDADTSSILWTSNQLGDMLQCSPAGSFTQYGLSHNYIYAGTRNDDTSSPNELVALNASDGSTVWSFDNGGNSNSSNAIGPINGGITVDYSTGNVIFSSRERSGGSSDTLWCVDEDGNKVWSIAIGDCDNKPTCDFGKVYVGTNSGVLYSISSTSGAINWSLNLGDSSITSYVSLDWTTGHLYVSTIDHIWCIQDNGNSATVIWNKPIDSPSNIVVVPPIGYLYVGSGDGSIHQISLDGSSESTMTLGDGSSLIGSPAYDRINQVIYVGSEKGTFYIVKVPF